MPGVRCVSGRGGEGCRRRRVRARRGCERRRGRGAPEVGGWRRGRAAPGASPDAVIYARRTGAGSCPQQRARITLECPDSSPRASGPLPPLRGCRSVLPLLAVRGSALRPARGCLSSRPATIALCGASTGGTSATRCMCAVTDCTGSGSWGSRPGRAGPGGLNSGKTARTSGLDLALLTASGLYLSAPHEGPRAALLAVARNVRLSFN